MSASDVDVRRATVDDAGDIAVMHVATWRTAYRGLMPQRLLDGLSVEARADAWRRILHDDASSTLVAFEPSAERVIGFVSVGPSRDTDPQRAPTEVYGLYLHPDCWGRGAGRHLLDSGLAQLPPATETTLWVLGSNARARRFYERQGWELDGASKGRRPGRNRPSGAALPPVAWAPEDRRAMRAAVSSRRALNRVR